MTNPLDDVTEKEIQIIKEISERHQLTPEDESGIMFAQAALMIAGFGRNKQTAKILRAIADMIESPIATAEAIEAKKNNKLQ